MVRRWLPALAASMLVLVIKVVVLSASPTHVKEVFPVELPRPRDQITTKELPEFVHLRARVFASIWRALREMFPALKGRSVTHAWGGVLGVPRDASRTTPSNRSTPGGRGTSGMPEAAPSHCEFTADSRMISPKPSVTMAR